MKWTTKLPDGQGYFWWRKEAQPGTATIVWIDPLGWMRDPRGPAFSEKPIKPEMLGGEWSHCPIPHPSEPEREPPPEE